MDPRAERAPGLPGGPGLAGDAGIRGDAVIRFRRPVESDHARIVAVIDEWWGGRKARHLLPRLWLQHFTGTSWIAETVDGRLAGFLVGFVSPDHPDLAYVHVAAANPNLRRRGIGRALYARFITDARARGARRVRAITWPDNRQSLAFHRAIGFRLHDGPGTRLAYGSPAVPDYEGDGSEITVLDLDIADWPDSGPKGAGPQGAPAA